MTVTCPAGHESETRDYCDQCGARIEAPPDPTVTLPSTPAAPAAELPRCPQCGEPVQGRFCENDGYDIVEGKPAAAVATARVLLDVEADRGHWQRMVRSGELPFPAAAPTLSLELTGDQATLGRVPSGAPVDVDLPLTGAGTDPAVSHHQCVFTRVGDGWEVRDAGSSNGTWINDDTAPLAAGASHRLADGDRIFVGAWTRLTVRLAPA